MAAYEVVKNDGSSIVIVYWRIVRGSHTEILDNSTNASISVAGIGHEKGRQVVAPGRFSSPCELKVDEAHEVCVEYCGEWPKLQHPDNPLDQVIEKLMCPDPDVAWVPYADWMKTLGSRPLKKRKGKQDTSWRSETTCNEWEAPSVVGEKLIINVSDVVAPALVLDHTTTHPLLAALSELVQQEGTERWSSFDLGLLPPTLPPETTKHPFPAPWDGFGPGELSYRSWLTKQKTTPPPEDDPISGIGDSGMDYWAWVTMKVTKGTTPPPYRDVPNVTAWGSDEMELGNWETIDNRSLSQPAFWVEKTKPGDFDDSDNVSDFTLIMGNASANKVSKQSLLIGHDHDAQAMPYVLYVILGLFALASFMLLSIVIRESNNFQKPAWTMQEPLMQK